MVKRGFIMNNNKDSIVIRSIKQVLKNDRKPSLKDHLINDLGLGSIDIAHIVAVLEIETGINPFNEDGFDPSSLQRVEDLFRIYKIDSGDNFK